MMSDICAIGFEVRQFGRSAIHCPRIRVRGRVSGGATASPQEEPPRWVGERAAPSLAPTHDGAGSPADTRPAPRRGGPARRRPRLRGPLPPLPAAHPRLRARHGQGPRPRGGRDAGGLRLRAAPHARDRAAAGVQALALPDRQERLHRRLPALQAHRGGLLRRRRRASRPPTTRGSSAPAPRPTPRSPPSRISTTSAARSAACRETHHEILVLRELEGLSYQEIGRRMGMSRPAVESTLFRARRRLTEEYDDIVSGARCLRIQGIIVTAVETRLGTRDTRRLARHLAHCQPCRREALAAGLDRSLFARPTRARARRHEGRRRSCRSRFFKFRRGADARRRAAGGRTAALALAPADALRPPLERLGQGRRGRRRARRRRGRRRGVHQSRRRRDAGRGRTQSPPAKARRGDGRRPRSRARAARATPPPPPRPRERTTARGSGGAKRRDRISPGGRAPTVAAADRATSAGGGPAQPARRAGDEPAAQATGPTRRRLPEVEHAGRRSTPRAGQEGRRRRQADDGRRQRHGPADHRRRRRRDGGDGGTVDNTSSRSRAAARWPRPSTGHGRRRRRRGQSPSGNQPTGDGHGHLGRLRGCRRLDCCPSGRGAAW